MEDQGEAAMDGCEGSNPERSEGKHRTPSESGHKEDLSNSFDGDQSDQTGDNDTTFDPDMTAGMSPDKEEFDQSELSESFSGSSVLDVYKIRVCELEQDISFLKQSITTVYDVFKYVDDCSIDLDMNSIPDLVYFLERVGEHLKSSDKIKDKLDDVETDVKNILGVEEDSDQANLEKQIYDVVDKCDTCKGVVSDIKTLVEKCKSYKRKHEFESPVFKRMKEGFDDKSSMPVFPEFRKPGETDLSATVNSYCGLPTISGEDGDVVVYTGQNFDMEQYLKETGLKRRRPMKYKCGSCHKEFSKLKYVKSHYQHQHVVQKKLYCNDCGLSFSYKSNLTRHQRLIHMGDRKEKCHMCDASFGTRSQLDSHLRKCHNAPKLNCADCGQTFIQEQSLRNHTEVCPANSNHVRVMCGICLKSFSAKRYLQNHIRAKHSDKQSKPHVCDICFKSFSGQFALKRHRVKKHKEVKNLAIREDIEDEHLLPFSAEIKLDMEKVFDVSLGPDDMEADEGEESLEEGEENGDMEMYGSSTVFVSRNHETLQEMEENEGETQNNKIKLTQVKKKLDSSESNKRRKSSKGLKGDLDSQCNSDGEMSNGDKLAVVKDKVNEFSKSEKVFKKSAKIRDKVIPYDGSTNYTKEEKTGINCKPESTDYYENYNEDIAKNAVKEVFEKKKAERKAGMIGNSSGLLPNSSRHNDSLSDAFQSAIESSYIGSPYGLNHAGMGLYPSARESLSNLSGLRPNNMMGVNSSYSTGVISPADALAALSNMNSPARQTSQMPGFHNEHFYINKDNPESNKHTRVKDENT